MQEKPGYKKRTIRNHLQRKVYDWLQSIDDAQLKASVENNIIVTGGAIPSMLMGEVPNDYDIYFSDNEIAERVAQYYVDKFNKYGVVGYYEPEVKREKKTNIKGIEEERVLVYIKSAGVADVADVTDDEDEERFVVVEDSTGNPDNNIDDMLVGEYIKETSEKMREDMGKYYVKYLSENAITLSDKIQLVLRFTGNAEEIHNNYDFVHTTNYYTYKDNNLVLQQEALEAIMSRSLVYQGSLYPVASIFRIRKFLDRGWKITAGQMLKIMAQISSIDLTNRDILRDQLIGVDVVYMSQLIKAIEASKKEAIDSTYLGELIDRIFGDQ